MNNVIQMNHTDQLIPIAEHQGRNAVGLRDLHQFLEIKGDFTSWAKQMFEYGFTEGQDYIEMQEMPSQSGNMNSGEYPNLRPKAFRNWAVSLDMAKELSMIQRTAKGKQARQYFIEVEKRARAGQNDKPKSLEEQALEIMGALQARVSEQAQELEVARPLAAQAKTYREADGLRTLTDLTNDLKVHAASNYPGRKVLRDDVFDLAGELGLIIRGNTVRHNQPTARAIEAGWVKPKSTVVETNNHGTYTKMNAHLTNRGYGRVWDEAVTRMLNNQPIFTPKTKAA